MTAVATNGTNAIVKLEAPSPLVAIAPRNLDDVFRLAQVAAKSGLYGVKSPEDAFIRMATGMELGLSAIQSLRGIWVLNGKPSLGAELMVALCLQHPECEAFELVESTAAKATWRTVRRGKETQLSWTIEQARAANLAGKDVWKAYPETMLRWRCASVLAKTVYPEKMMGLLSVEEAASIGKGARVEVDGGIVVPADAPSSPAKDLPPLPKAEDETVANAAVIEAAIRAASDGEMLDAAGAWVARAERENHITPEQAKTLARMGKAKRKELGG